MSSDSMIDQWLPGLAGGGRRIGCKGVQTNFLGLIEKFYIMIVMVVTFVKAHQTVYLKLLNFCVCKLYFNKKRKSGN